MKKYYTVILIILLFLFNSYVFSQDEFFDFYSEFSIDYGTIISPAFIENNTTGTYDTPMFSAKAGIDILKWGSIYLGTSFYFFVEQQNKQNHYSFIPIYLGIKANILPDYFIYPSLYFEMGKSISNYHYTYYIEERDIPWTADYYNVGIALNLNINDIVSLNLNIERPWISYYEKDKYEIHIIKSGIGFKILF